jgi:hypothetical protein
LFSFNRLLHASAAVAAHMAQPVLHSSLIAQGWAVAGTDDEGEYYFENESLDLTAYVEDLPPTDDGSPAVMDPTSAGLLGALGAIGSISRPIAAAEDADPFAKAKLPSIRKEGGVEEVTQGGDSSLMSATEGNNDELNGELAAQKRLHLAWEMHGALSFAAHKQVMIANVLQLLSLGFGLCTLGITLLRINIEDDQGSEGDGEGDVDWDCETSDSSGCQLTKYLQVIFPALVTTLLTVQSYLDPDGQAIVLTSGAARIETEIYMFRTSTGPYGRSGFASGSASSGGGSSGLVSSREHFGQKITAIWDGILKSSVSEHSMPRRDPRYDHRARLRKQYLAAQDMVAKYMPGEDPWPPPPKQATAQKSTRSWFHRTPRNLVGKMEGKKLPPSKGRKKITPTESVKKHNGMMQEDSGFGSMSSDDYVRFRMLPKLIAYSKLSPRQARQKSFLKVMLVVLFAIATLLGAVDEPVPVPFIVQVASAVAGWVAFQQMNVSLKLTNSAVGRLEGLVLWWQSLSMIEKSRPDRKQKLVLITEEVISAATPALAISKHLATNNDDFTEERKPT